MTPATKTMSVSFFSTRNSPRKLISSSAAVITAPMVSQMMSSPLGRTRRSLVLARRGAPRKLRQRSLVESEKGGRKYSGSAHDTEQDAIEGSMRIFWLLARCSSETEGGGGGERGEKGKQSIMKSSPCMQLLLPRSWPITASPRCLVSQQFPLMCCKLPSPTSPHIPAHRD